MLEEEREIMRLKEALKTTTSYTLKRDYSKRIKRLTAKIKANQQKKGN